MGFKQVYFIVGPENFRFSHHLIVQRAYAKIRATTVVFLNELWNNFIV